MSGRVVSVAAVVSLLVASAAWGLRGEANIDARTTGDNSELIKSIPIEKNARGAKTALKLDPDEMPQVLPGDRLRVSSEILVTTDCLFDSPRCVGKPYKFNPTIDTFLILDSGEDEIELKSDRRRCLQEEDERQHHCQIAFVGVEAGQAADQLDCDINNCSLKVKVRAFAAEADGGERMVIGSNQPNGDIEQDKARLNAIRIRPPAVVPEPFTSGPVRNDFAPVLEKVVLYSQKLNALKQGEVIEAAIDARATTDHLGYPALLGTQIILAEKARDRRPSGLVKRLATTAGEITEISGTNCTPKQSPCPITRTGIIEMRKDARAGGQVVPLYVNVIARSKAKRADADRGDKVKLKDFRGLRVWRYSE